MRRTRGLLLILFVFFAFAAPSRAQGPAQIYLNCGAVPAGIGPQTITLRVRLDCPGGQPAVIAVVIPAGTAATAKADLIRGACGPASPGNSTCNPAETAIAVDPIGSGARIQFSSFNAAHRIVNFQVTDATQEPGSLQGVNGSSAKWLAIQGTVAPPIAGQEVFATANPTVNIILNPNETATSAVTRLQAAFTAVPFPTTLVNLGASNILDRAALQNASNTVCIRVSGHPAGFGPDGVWTQCITQGSAFAGVSQIDDPIAQSPSSIPVLPGWGMIALTVLILGAGVVILIRASRLQPATG